MNVESELSASQEKKMLKCRLCSSPGENGIMAFSDEGLIRCLQQHIKKYLYITVTMDDKLTKFVCSECLNMLESFHCFAIMASQSQRDLIQASKDETSKKATTNGLLHAYLTKETVNKDHDYATSEKNSKKKRIRKFKEKNISSIPNQNNNNNINNNNNNNNNELLIDASDSNTHETLEIVVDPSLYLESSCESLQDDHNHSQPPCLMCDFNFTSISPNSIDGDHNETNNNEKCSHDDTNNDNDDNGKDYSCPICGKKNFTPVNLKLHLRIHRPKGKHECDICKRIFKSNANLAQHKIYHNRVQFQCEICQRVYPTQSTLKAHAITHSDLRPHQCQLCEKSFKRNQDLKFHMNQHTGARPYKCIYCPKAFASSGNCFSHRKRMHPDEVERDRNFAAKILR